VTTGQCECENENEGDASHGRGGRVQLEEKVGRVQKLLRFVGFRCVVVNPLFARFTTWKGRKVSTECRLPTSEHARFELNRTPVIAVTGCVH
jgi:hypothetical protein